MFRLVTAVLVGGVLLAPARAGEPAGDRVTLSVKDMATKDVLETLAVQHRLNIVASQDVTGTVTVNLYDLTVDEALDAILGVNGYSFTRRDKVIYVSKPPEAPLSHAVLPIKWLTAEELVGVLSQFSGKDGKVAKAETGDAIVVRDTDEAVQLMRQIVAELDVRPKQVMIEAQMIEVGEDSLEEIGFNWSALSSLKVIELTAERSYDRTRTETDTNTTPEISELNRQIGSVISLRAGILDENSFNVLASFFENLTDTHVVAQPRILTLDGREATIMVGTVVPIPKFDFAKDTGTRTLSGFQEEQIGTKIQVTPHVGQDDFILLEVIPSVEGIDGYITVEGDPQRPIKSTKRAETQVLVRDGHTMVIGGLRGKSRIRSTGRVPFVHRIPVLGWMFKNRDNDVQYSELIIFITPRLVDEDNLSSHERQIRDATDAIQMQPVWRQDFKR